MHTMSLEKTPKGVDKVMRYNWTVKDSPGRLMGISKHLLRVDETYQREHTSSKVMALAAEWSWVACGAVVVAHRHGAYYIIDGQHRVLAALRRSDIDHMPCIVFESDDVQSEAKGFLDLNSNRKPIPTIAKLKALAVAGDEVAMFVVDFIESRGLSISKSLEKKGDIKCIAAMLKMANMDKSRFVRAMDAAILASHDGPIYEKVVRGLFYIDTHVDGGLSSKLVERASSIGSHNLIQAIHKAQAFYSNTGEKIWAAGILEEVNKGLKNRYKINM